MSDMGKEEAWITLATNDDYAIGALVLGQSLRNVKTTKLLHIIITSGVSQIVKNCLNRIFDQITEVDPLNSNDEANLILLRRPDLAITFTKLHCWRLTQYSKCVFLDADCLMLKNCDELFERYDEFSAAPDVGWPDVFNSGVFVMRPSLETYDRLIKFAEKYGSFDGGDQGLLNEYFNGWKYSQQNRLPFTYNTSSSTSYTYISAFKRFYEDIRIVHFLGQTKPWHYKYNILSGMVLDHRGGLEGFNNNLEHVRMWWCLFVQNIMPHLFELPERLLPIVRHQEPEHPIEYYYEPPTPPPYYEGRFDIQAPPQAPDHYFHHQQPSVLPTHHDQPVFYRSPPAPQPYIHHQDTPAQTYTYYYYEPQTAIRYHQPEQPQQQPNAQPPPFAACVAYNIEPQRYAYFHYPMQQQQQFQQPQEQQWNQGSTAWMPSHAPQQPQQHYWPPATELTPIHYTEQPWQPPDLPKFIGGELAAVDKPFDAAHQPRVWPPLLAEVARLLAESAGLRKESGEYFQYDEQQINQMLNDVADNVPQEILNRPLDKSIQYPSQQFSNRMKKCPLCQDSFDYLDEYFPMMIDNETDVIFDNEFDIEKLDAVVDKKISGEPSSMGETRRQLSQQGDQTTTTEFDYEDYEHKLAFEQGNVDYTGRDSWDNIMQHLFKSFQ